MVHGQCGCCVYSSLENVTAMLHCARRMVFFFWGGGREGEGVCIGKKERKKERYDFVILLVVLVWF